MFAKTRRKKNSSKRSYYHDRDLLCGRKQLLIWLINLDDCVKSNNYIKGISWLEQSARIIEILSKDCKQSSEYFWNQYSIIHWNLANSLHNFDMQSNGGFIFENWKIQLKKIEMIRFETKSMQFCNWRDLSEKKKSFNYPYKHNLHWFKSNVVWWCSCRVFYFINKQRRLNAKLLHLR